MGYVYLLAHRDGDRFKIGKALDIWQRFKTVGGPQAFDLARSLAVEVDSHTKLEKRMHQQFAFSRLPAIKGLDGGTEYFAMAAFEQARQVVKSYPCARVHDPLESLIGNRAQRSIARIPSPEVYERARIEDAEGLRVQFDTFISKVSPYVQDGVILGCLPQREPDHYTLLVDQHSPQSQMLMEHHFPMIATSFGGRGSSMFALITGGSMHSGQRLAFMGINFPSKTADLAAQFNPLSLPHFARLYEFYAAIPGFLQSDLPKSVEYLVRKHVRAMRSSGYDLKRSNLNEWFPRCLIKTKIPQATPL